MSEQPSADVLAGRVMLVTGGSRGIGAATARLAAASGARLVVNYLRDAAAAAAVVDGIAAAGGEARAIQADVADEDQVAAMFRRIRDELGGVDAVFNRAGVLSSALLTMTRAADFDALMAVNARGSFLVMRQAAKQMLRRGGGAIINCSSIIGRRGASGHVGYAASKAAVIGMTLAAARELGPLGITVNAVAPGLIDTDTTAALSAEVRDRIVAAIPAGHVGTADEVARLVVFLASPDAAYINGQVLGVDGGQLS